MKFYATYRAMDSMPASPEVTYNWVDITSDFFKYIQGIFDTSITLSMHISEERY